MLTSLESITTSLSLTFYVMNLFLATSKTAPSLDGCWWFFRQEEKLFNLNWASEWERERERRKNFFSCRLHKQFFLVIDWQKVETSAYECSIFSPHPSNPIQSIHSFVLNFIQFIFATKLLQNMTCWVLKIARNVYMNHKGVIRLRLEFFQLSKSLACLMCFNYNVMGVVGLRWLNGST